MAISYFIMVRHEPVQFRWLWKAIYSEDDAFCIHVDAKSPDSFASKIRAIVGDAGNVRWLPRRSLVGSRWSVVTAELEAMRLMLSEVEDWQRWINLTGQDYPIKPIDQIRESLGASTSNHIQCASFESLAEEERDSPHLGRRIYLEFGGKVHRTPLRLPFPSELNLEWKGSTWHMLTRSFCEWATTTPLSRAVAKSLRFSFCPDETFFQGLIMNGPFAETVDQQCGRLSLGPGPKTLTIRDLDEIRRSPCLFGRKFNHKVDGAVLHMLASECYHASRA